MSANDENRIPTTHAKSSIDTNVNPHHSDGPSNHHGQDSADHSAGTSGGSQPHSPQSATSQGGSQTQNAVPRTGLQVAPSLDTIPEAFAPTTPSSPAVVDYAQYAALQSGTYQRDNLPPSPSEQHATASYGSQVTSALSNAMGALGLTQLPSRSIDNNPQHASSQHDNNQADRAPPVSHGQEASFQGGQVISPFSTVEQASDISASSSLSYPSPQDDPEHALSLNGIDEADFAPPLPSRQFEYSRVPAGLQNIRQQDMLHGNQEQGDSSGQPAGDSAPPLPPRSHTRQSSVDERPGSSVLPHERVTGGIGSSTRYSPAPPPVTALSTAPSVAPSYLNLSPGDIMRALPPSHMDESAIEDSPPSSPDGPSTHTTSTAVMPAAPSGHVTVAPAQRSDLTPLSTTSCYAPGQQSVLTPFPTFTESLSSDEEASREAETSPTTHPGVDGPTPRASTSNPLPNAGAPSSSGEAYSPWSPISPRAQTQTRQETDTSGIAFEATSEAILGIRNDLSAEPANATDDVIDVNQQEVESLARARTEPQDQASRHEHARTIRQTQSADNNNSTKEPGVKFDDDARRKADFDDMWAKERPRQNVSNEARGGKRKGSDVGMHKPLVKFARKYAGKTKELWLDTTTGKNYIQRGEARAVKEAHKISQEVHESPSDKPRMPSVTEIAKSPGKSLRRLSSRCFSKAAWERSTNDGSTNESSASPATADADAAERRRFSSIAGSMRGSIGNLTSRMKPNFRRSRSEANVLGPDEKNIMDTWRASQEPRRAEQTNASPNLNVNIDSSRLVSPTTTRTSPFDVHPGCLTGSLTINGQEPCTHTRTVPIARTESERRNDPENVPTMLEAMPSVPSLVPDNGTSDESETSSQVEAKSPNKPTPN